MKTFLTILSSLLLLFNGTGAILGGWNLIVHPDGSSMQMSLDYLKHSPFNDYLIPGVVLLTANGLFSFFVLAAIVFHLKYDSWLIMAQGAILTGWIVIQVAMLQIVNILHFIFGSAGLLLIICGWELKRMQTSIRK